MALRLIPRPESTAAQHGTATAANVVALARIRGDHGVMVQDVTPRGSERALTAAAAVLAGGKTPTSKMRVNTTPWQKEVWELRRETGEMRFSGDRVAKALSRVKLFIAEVTPDTEDPKPAEHPSLQDLSQQMFSNSSPALMRAGQHLVFAGETILLVSQDQDSLAMTWEPHSTTEVVGQGKSWQINDGSGEPVKVDPSRQMLVRCWTKDPERGYYAESPVQAVLPSARILRALTKRTSAEIDSRLAGNGLLVLPDSVEVVDGQGTAQGRKGIVGALLESMITPIKDPDSASAVVPLIIKVAPDAVDKINHITFASPLDPRTKELRDEEIRRIALGMDSAPEVLLGMGSGANHWSAWQIDESEAKFVVAPLAQTVCHALTTGWLVPCLKQLGLDPSKYLVWYDLEALQLRPDRSADARELYRDGVLSADATLRENGFSPEDRATEPPATATPPMQEMPRPSSESNPLPNGGTP